MVKILREKVKEVERQEKSTPKKSKNRTSRVVTVFFQRTDALDKDVSLRTTFDESMDLVVKRAAKELGLSDSKIGVLIEGQPVSFTGKTVGEIIKHYDAVSYQISSADMLGSWREREPEEEETTSKSTSDELSTPPTGAGLMRFYDQETGGPKIGGKGVMILATLFLGGVLGAWYASQVGML